MDMEARRRELLRQHHELSLELRLAQRPGVPRRASQEIIVTLRERLAEIDREIAGLPADL